VSLRKGGRVGTALVLAPRLVVVRVGDGRRPPGPSPAGYRRGHRWCCPPVRSNTTVAWTNVTAGERKSALVSFKNTGTGPEDFHLVFATVPPCTR
jgi:hypothetical protein